MPLVFRAFVVIFVLAGISACAGVFYKDENFSGDMQKRFPVGSTETSLLDWLRDEGYEQSQERFPIRPPDRIRELETKNRCWRNNYAILWIAELYRIVCFQSDTEVRIKEILAHQAGISM